LLRVGGAAPPAASRLLRSYLAAQLLPAATPRFEAFSVETRELQDRTVREYGAPRART